MSKIAVILIRGLVGVRTDIRETLKYLNIERKHKCVIVEDTPSVKGMLKKIVDVATFGEVSDETIKLLKEKREVISKDGTPKKFFSLAPPKGGFERKGIKKPYSVGGALGYRGEKINDLILKML